MIFTLPNTTTQEIAKTLVKIRDTGGQVTTSRVLTLIVVARDTSDIEGIIRATNEASQEHPSRVIILVAGSHEGESQVDAEVRIGGDAGASEMILIKLAGRVAKHLVHVVTPLLLPDTPIVAWWPSSAPINPAEDPIGKIAQRRITDSHFDPPVDALYNRRNHYAPGDSDFSWARLTPWRGVLASSLDQAPYEMVQDVRVYGESDCPSVDLAAGWLCERLGISVERHNYGSGSAAFDDAGLAKIPVKRIELERPSGCVVIEALDDDQTLSVSIPGRSTAHVAVTRRSQADCLAEELRHLDPDIAYARALRGLSRVSYPTQ
ncbi:glucose-6-phosphate dehydrogenase assembly protein OpcA [Corynebacterium diphtheriae bv. mitis]|uniref:glucose-6-phosphate dehydrogenase assembly protein OpcA n=1 Tax=Corynebacterium diphtheriae TaxID=1717 RepID=UPI0013CA1536|nr:glucose-6-phosphate dehydrogenase assembly protein OpcA [Corynebacterium diphtheriae]MBG9290302.1 glucose-6-phosphate dehydrogenase assembly protein OpcA [Corynebacterium diphtheriae bv. gravis]MBG9312994.1 glucose-6-phosphate dehydrogenase assembly protein OpcA [Corynebacterium diphtheriae bv. mitis]CAB0688790.1 oxppcycle protein OpcA [Corynebacterium diphtheriae]CAB0698930.1 oxppcycle protein OpcA [Corynebacterium diphtheriae]CAB0817386.1 oxppcycle protein OpcA [Corynebacterium diphtheria